MRRYGIGVKALRLQCLTYGLNGWVMISNMMMQTTGKMFRASFMGVSRQGVFLIPGVLLMPPLIGILGIQIAQPLADAISFLVCLVLQISLLRELDREEKMN